MNSKQIITVQEMKDIELNMLIQFAKFCDENNLKYSLCGGTLLGAVRHKGFIPWDDDIDLFIPRDTYTYLCKHFNKWGKKNNLKLINYYSNGYYSTFAKIIDTRTIAIEEKRNEKIGIWIDLFIVDSMKSNKATFSDPIINDLKEIRYFGSDDYFFAHQSLINNFKNLKKLIVRLIKKPILRHKIESFIKNNKGDCDVSYSFADQIIWWEQTQHLDFDNSINLIFEKKEFKSISNWKYYLEHRYGSNYMDLPPIENRISHPLTKCIWKRKK